MLRESRTKNAHVTTEISEHQKVRTQISKILSVDTDMNNRTSLLWHPRMKLLPRPVIKYLSVLLARVRRV